jgi:hypothetical protein
LEAEDCIDVVLDRSPDAFDAVDNDFKDSKETRELDLCLIGLASLPSQSMTLDICSSARNSGELASNSFLFG